MPANVTVWNGTTEVPATVTVWNGTAEVAAQVYIWDGTNEVPVTVPPTTGFIGSVTASHASTSSSTAITLTVPSGVTATDRCTLLLTNSNSAATVASTGMTAVVGPTDTGTQQAVVLTGAGHTAGGTLTITGTNLNPSAVVAVWHRGYNHGTPASAVRASTVTTISCPAATGAVTGDLVLVLAAEKSGANTDNLAPTVAPGVTQRGWAPWNSNATGMPSAYIGEYAGAGAARTATYLRSSANGLGAQVRLTPA